MGRASIFLCCVALSTSATAASAQGWPRSTAPHVVQIAKVAGLEDPGGLPDAFWIHLHRNHHSAVDAPEATLRVRMFRNNSIYDKFDEDPSADPWGGLRRVKFLVHGVDVSGWLTLPTNSKTFTWVLSIDNPNLATVPDGLHDISVDVEGPTRDAFMPAPIFLHLTRGGTVSPDAEVPMMSGAAGNAVIDGGPESGLIGGQVIDAGPHVQYVRASQRQFRAYPVDPSVTPFYDPPYAANLFAEMMTPNVEYSGAAQMWWEELPHHLPFVRALTPKQSNDDHRFLRVQNGQERMPFKDGGRGIGWMGALVSGQVDSQGRFAFAEAGGRLGYLMPDGEIVTIAGWRVAPGKDPVWITKSLAQIRGNEQLRGVWTEGAYPGEAGGFRTPLDVTVDPRDEHTLFVAAYEDHCIWKVVVDPATHVGTVSVFAGDPHHARGSADGVGHAARFSGPTSVVFDPVNDVLYVADQDQHLIRRITRAGQVTTLFGRTDIEAELARRGVSDRFNRDQVRPAMRLTVSATDAANGLRPDIYVPMTVRVDSHGRIITLGLGDGMIRRIDPATGVTEILGRVDSKFERDGGMGWAWLDVDRWGNAGPRDGIYWCKTVGSEVDGEVSARHNEVYAWMPPNGGGSRFIFGEVAEWHPNAWGDTRHMGPQHYPWLVAVDPRGALLIAGIGEHGITRVRARKSTDHAPTDYERYQRGQVSWRQGSPDGLTPSRTFMFGYDGHNYLGFPDVWGLTGHETDQQLFDLFGAPASLRQNAAWAEAWLYMVRENESTPGPAPPPPPPPPGGFRRYLAEGSTGSFFDTRIAILNPQEAPTDATLRFQRDDGVVVTHTLTVPGRTRRTILPRTIGGLENATFSTVIDSSLPLIVDRTMTWQGYGSHAETSLPGPATTWYLAEGATSDPFDLFYLLQNPNDSAATVTVTYLRPAPLAPLEKTYQVGANSRMNIWVDKEELPAGSGQTPLGQGDVSARITASLPIAVERAMYFSQPGQPFAAGHASAGVTAAATRWFFAEGATGSFFDLFILLANPGARDATVEAQYLTTEGTVLTKTYTVAADSRQTIWVDEETFGADGKRLAEASVSTTITSTNGVPIIAERSMWWPQGRWYEAHNSPGATATGTRWALAEGEVGGPEGTQTYILIANTSDATAEVRVTLLFEDGAPADRAFTIGAHSRFNVDVAAEFPAADGRRLGAVVESLGSTPAPIVVERAMYTSGNGVLWSAGTNALGTPLH